MKHATRLAIFKWRQTAPELILCALRWDLRYSLSLRDVEELLAERGLAADHTTIWRWLKPTVPNWSSGGLATMMSVGRIYSSSSSSSWRPETQRCSCSPERLSQSFQSCNTSLGRVQSTSSAKGRKGRPGLSSKCRKPLILARILFLRCRCCEACVPGCA